MAQVGRRETSESEEAIEVEDGGEEGGGAEEITDGMAGSQTAPEHQLQPLNTRVAQQYLQNGHKTKSRRLALAQIPTLIPTLTALLR